MELAGFMLRACALLLDVIIAAAVILAAGFTFGDGSAGVIIVAMQLSYANRDRRRACCRDALMRMEDQFALL